MEPISLMALGLGVLLFGSGATKEANDANERGEGKRSRKEFDKAMEEQHRLHNQDGTSDFGWGTSGNKTSEWIVSAECSEARTNVHSRYRDGKLEMKYTDQKSGREITKGDFERRGGFGWQER